MMPLLVSLLLTYEPLAVPSLAPPSVLELEVPRGDADHVVPLRVYLPETKSPAPVLLFSHGLGGSRELDAFLGEHWARRGYVAVFLQHPGSDTSIWKDLAPARRLAALSSAANVENFIKRVTDVHRTLDTLTTWNTEPHHALQGRLDLARVGMSGHSFGAVTTQAVSGQRFPLGESPTDARIKAAMALSPSMPRMGSAETAFSHVSIPWLLMTGTKDRAPIGGQTPESRREVYPALPAGQKYELVLDGAEHSAFTDRALPGDTEPRNPNHHRLLMAVSTAFFDATLKGDLAARAWLEGAGIHALLEAKDLWQWK
jgi:predicted dienelactone hydrolase